MIMAIMMADGNNCDVVAGLMVMMMMMMMMIIMVMMMRIGTMIIMA